MTKLKNSYYDKTQTVTKLEKKTIVTKLKQIFFTKLKNLNCDKTIKKIKLWQHSKAQIRTIVENSNCDKTQKP